MDDQIGFLEASCASFDGGFEGESKRLALTLRVLAHDTNHSKSLLGQLGKLGEKFLDTAYPLNPTSIVSHGGLVFVSSGPPEPSYVAMLDNVPKTKWVSFDDWWNSVVFKDTHGGELSRKKLILTAANQDGGGHVDPKLEEEYAAFSK